MLVVQNKYVTVRIASLSQGSAGIVYLSDHTMHGTISQERTTKRYHVYESVRLQTSS